MKETVIKNNFWTKNKTGILTYGALFLVVGTISTLLIIKGKRNNNNQVAGETRTPTGFCKYGDSFPLKYGSCGKKVKALQQILQLKGADLGAAGIDGKYGEKTQTATEKYFRVSSVTSILGKKLRLV